MSTAGWIRELARIDGVGVRSRLYRSCVRWLWSRCSRAQFELEYAEPEDLTRSLERLNLNPALELATKERKDRKENELRKNFSTSPFAQQVS